MSVKTRGAAPGAPRPSKRMGKTAASAWYLRVAVLALLTVVVLLAVIVLGGGARADKLREFDQALFEAQRSFLRHFDPGADTNLLEAHARFADGELSADGLEQLAETWASDFTDARDAVRGLDPNTSIAPAPTPEELIQASWFMAEALEAWRGVALMYPRAAELKRAADQAAGSLRTSLSEQLDALLAEIDAWRQRASNLHELGARQVQNLRRDWGVESGPQLRPAPPPDDGPAP